MSSTSTRTRQSTHATAKWSSDEHERYLTALERYPNSSWKVIAEFVGTRTARQVMSHAQKLAQKKQRHLRGLRPAGRPRKQPLPISPTSVEGTGFEFPIALPGHSSLSSNSYDSSHDSPWKQERVFHDGVEWAGDDDADWAVFDTLQNVLNIITTESVQPSSPQSDFGGDPTLWSCEDLEWFAELERLHQWE